MAKTNDGLDAARRHKAAVESAKTRTADFTTLSGERVDSLYTPSDIADVDYERDLGVPGEYPFTRGPYPNMYRGRMWTMRQFSGFGTAHESNQRTTLRTSRPSTARWSRPSPMSRSGFERCCRGTARAGGRGRVFRLTRSPPSSGCFGTPRPRS